MSSDTDGLDTDARIKFPRVWSCFTTLIVAALGILVSSMTSTLYELDTYVRTISLLSTEGPRTASRPRQGRTTRNGEARSF